MHSLTPTPPPPVCPVLNSSGNNLSDCDSDAKLRQTAGSLLCLSLIYQEGKKPFLLVLAVVSNWQTSGFFCCCSWSWQSTWGLKWWICEGLTPLELLHHDIHAWMILIVTADLSFKFLMQDFKNIFFFCFVFSWEALSTISHPEVV